MASGAKPARIGAIGLDYWGPNLVRSFDGARRLFSWSRID